MNTSSRERSATKAGNFLRLVGPYAYRLMATIRRRNRVRPTGLPMRRILIMHGGHIGDVVISTAIVQILRSAFPNAELGFATGSWSIPVVRNYPGIAYTHCIDHWLMNRSDASRLSKFMHYIWTRRAALAQIRHLRYDLALSIYPHFLADLLSVAWAAEIPGRIGFSHSLDACMATDLVEMSRNPFVHQSAVQAEVLRPLGLDSSHYLKGRPYLPDTTDEANAKVLATLGIDNPEMQPYSVIHMGSGARNRELDSDFWSTIAISLAKTQLVVFTGKGARENANIERTRCGLPNTVNACDHLDWEGFVTVIRHAQTLYGVESMAGHVAAAVGTNCRVVYTGVTGAARWRPYSDNCIVFTNHVPCAPCYNLKGCESMTCLKSITPGELTNILPMH